MSLETTPTTFCCFTTGYLLKHSIQTTTLELVGNEATREKNVTISNVTKINTYSRFNPLVIFMRIFGSCLNSCAIFDDHIINGKVVYCKKQDILNLINWCAKNSNTLQITNYPSYPSNRRKEELTLFIDNALKTAITVSDDDFGSL